MSNIQQRINFISQQMQKIRASGDLAPANTWIQKFYVPRNGKKYTYYRLMRACNRKSSSGKIQGKIFKYLGKLGSRLYRHYVEAIERRNQVQKLERIYRNLLKIQEAERISECYLDNEGYNEASEIKQSLNKLRRAIEAIAKNQQHLFQWLKVVARRVGIDAEEWNIELNEVNNS